MGCYYADDATGDKNKSDNCSDDFSRLLKARLKSSLQWDLTMLMTQLEKKMKAALRRFSIGASDVIVAAVSGGADSTAMLDALVRLQIEDRSILKSILVAHLNHQLRGEESDRDEAFVKRLADEFNLPVFVERIAVADFAQKAKRNLEATARKLRYDF